MKRRMFMGGTALLTVLAVGLGMPLTASGAVGWTGNYYWTDPDPEPEPSMTEIPGSGGVNCRGGDVCVEKIGDTAEVSWEIQSTPAVTDNVPMDFAGVIPTDVSDEINDASAKGTALTGGTVIAVPKVLDDVKLETIALPKPVEMTSETSGLSTETELISEPVPVVEQTEPLPPIGGSLLKDLSSTIGAVAPAVGTSPEDWQANLYTDYNQLYGFALLDLLREVFISSGLSEANLNDLAAREVDLSKIDISKISAIDLSSVSFLPGYVPDSELQEVYEILRNRWDEVVDDYNKNHYIFERYVPYWFEALQSGNTDDLTYSPLLALQSAYDWRPFSDDIQDAYLMFNLIDAMAAVEAEHPEVLEPREPLNDEITPSGVAQFGKGLLTQDQRELIDNLYYKDDTDEVDEEAIKYPAQKRHQDLAEKAVKVYFDYQLYMFEVMAHGFDDDMFNVKNDDLYNYIYIPASVEAKGVSSFKLTGTVTVQTDETYLPVRVWRPSNAFLYQGNGEDVFLNASMALTDEMISSMPELPDYSLTDAQVNDAIAQQQTDKTKGKGVTKDFRATSAATDGRLGTQQCAPTSEKYGVWNILGTDTAQTPQSTSLIFLSTEGEDGCDQSDVLVTICDEEPNPPSPHEDEPAPPSPNEEATPMPNNTSVSSEKQQDTAGSVVVSQPQALSGTGASVVGVLLFGVMLLGVGVMFVWCVKHRS